ncbi:hypothetical protein ACN28S_57760 [Cystobacter fuscus]
MNRFLASDDEIIFGQREAVVEIMQERFGVWTLELSLLLQGLAESLTVRSPNGGTLLLSLLADKRVKRSTVSRGGTNKLRFDLSRTQTEYLQTVLLRAYRDGMADVDHVHIEGEFAGTAYDLTFFFGASQPPMSAEEAAKRMQD